jgi:hypothetical protein
MFKFSNAVLLFIMFICLSMSACTNNQQYLDNTKQTYNLIIERTAKCNEILSQYSSLLEASSWMSPTTLDSVFFKVYEKHYGNRSEKLKLLDPKILEESMIKLRNPPRKYESTYNKMLELYGAYTKIQRIVVNAEGSEVRSSIRQINQTLEEIITLKNQLNVMLK